MYSTDCSVGVILTKSPETHLKEALGQFGDEVAFQSVGIDSCVLYDFKSEERFRSMLHDFYFSKEKFNGGFSAVKVVQCDPVQVSYTHVRHAIRIAEEEYRRRTRWSLLELDDDALLQYFESSSDPAVKAALEQGVVPPLPRRIIFVMHLPPGMRSKTRKFPLDFLLVSLMRDMTGAVKF